MTPEAAALILEDYAARLGVPPPNLSIDVDDAPECGLYPHYDAEHHQIHIDEQLLAGPDFCVNLVLAHECGHARQRESILRLGRIGATVFAFHVLAAVAAIVAVLFCPDSAVRSSAVPCTVVGVWLSFSVFRWWRNRRYLKDEFEADSVAADILSARVAHIALLMLVGDRPVDFEMEERLARLKQRSQQESRHE